MNMVNDAIREYKKILDRNPSNFMVHYKLAEIYFKRNEVDDGVLHLEKILQFNKYNYEVEKIEVQRRLGKAYLLRNEIEQAFEMYYEILRLHPGDQESLYHVSFISLGQGLFEVAYKNFIRLASQNRKSFEILFGAGIAAYQNHRTDEAVSYFKDALGNESHSDIGNLAMAFALYRKKDFKTAVNYAKMIIESSTDENALLISRRLLGFLNVQSKRSAESVKIFQELLAGARKDEDQDEIMTLLYDLGFACIKAEQTDNAYEYWNELYGMGRDFRNIQVLTMLLRKEMDVQAKGQQQKHESVVDYVEGWIKDAFPENFLWDICGLKSDAEIDLKKIIVSSRTFVRGEVLAAGGQDVYSSDAFERLDTFMNLDAENFRIISNRVVGKLGFSVDEILQTYRENDGVDFLAKSVEDKNIKALVWVRRWKAVQVGEIPLRNFAQAVNDVKVNQGLFITATDLTPAGENAATHLSKITVIFPEKLAELLANLV